jgi:hypothetical protein
MYFQRHVEHNQDSNQARVMGERGQLTVGRVDEGVIGIKYSVAVQLH